MTLMTDRPLASKLALVFGLMISASACSYAPNQAASTPKDGQVNAVVFASGEGAAAFASRILGTYRDNPSERNFFYVQVAGYLELRADGSYRKAEDVELAGEAVRGQWQLDTSADALPYEPLPELEPMPVEGVPGPSAEVVMRVNEERMAAYNAPRALLTLKSANAELPSEELVIVKILSPDKLLLIDGHRQTAVYRQPSAVTR
jgi:hypothetical protein